MKGLIADHIRAHAPAEEPEASGMGGLPPSVGRALRLAAALAMLLLTHDLFGKVYHVGPERALKAIGQVPWESLEAGDHVLIDWRREPYREKWVLCRRGTKDSPIVVRGMPGPDGRLPVIDGQNATTRTALRYWGDARGVFKIGGATLPTNCIPEHIVVESLDIRGSRPPAKFVSATGETKEYKANAAALYVEKARHLTVRNCVLSDSGNGLFVASGDDSASADILVEGCHIYGNGNPGSGREHNVYTEAIGIVFQFNHFGALGKGCIGNNIKDRSAGLVVRFNWIEGGDKPLDLVDAEDSALVRLDPGYRKTVVCGNIIIKPDKRTHPQVVHYGGDSSNKTFYRGGVLYFHNNTVISTRESERTTLFWLSSRNETCDCRNNIFYVAGDGKTLDVLQDAGTVRLSHNWFKTGWRKGDARDEGGMIDGASPGFKNAAEGDFSLVQESPCRKAGATLSLAASIACAIDKQYVKHRKSAERIPQTPPDIGAFGQTTMDTIGGKTVE